MGFVCWCDLYTKALPKHTIDSRAYEGPLARTADTWGEWRRIGLDMKDTWRDDAEVVGLSSESHADGVIEHENE